MHYHARDMAVVRAHIAKIPVVLASATPSVETEVNARRGRYQRVVLPARFGGQHMPHIEAIDLRRAGAAARPLHLAAAGEAGQVRASRRKRAGAAVPQPPRLCAADAVPRLRPSLRLPPSATPGWSITAFARRLVCHHCGFSMPRRRPARIARPWNRSSPVGPGVERLQEEAAAIVSGCAHHRAVERPDRPRSSRCAANSTAIAAGRVRHHHRHAAGGQGPSLSAAQSGRRGRCRSRARQRRSARRRADVSVAATGDRAAPAASRAAASAILQTHQPEHPVMKALVAATARRSTPARSSAREAHRLSAVRPARQPDHFGGRPADGRRLCAQAGGDRAARRADPRAGPRRSAARGDRGRYRFRLLIKSLRNFDLSEYLREWLAQRRRQRAI